MEKILEKKHFVDIAGNETIFEICISKIRVRHYSVFLAARLYELCTYIRHRPLMMMMMMMMITTTTIIIVSTCKTSFTKENKYLKYLKNGQW